MRPGTRVGRYEIVGEIGRGAMGAVWRARDPKLGREVAIKTIATAMSGGDDRAEISARFEREARVAAQLAHPNIVGIYDAGSEGDSLYLVMELVEGETLGRRLATGRFPAASEALEIAAQAADALSCAHEAGVIHRDIKPANLLIGRDGRVKVSDFGVAKAVSERTELTRTGMMVGSPAYMAPEQIKGMPLDGRSDLFSLGVVLFEMLLGRKPFPADTVTTLVYQILHEDPFEDAGLATSLGGELADFLRQVLAKDREARLADARTFARRARELAARLAGGAATRPVGDSAPTTHLAPRPAAALPPPAAPPPVAAARRLWHPSWIFGITAAAAVAAVALMMLRRTPEPPAAGREPARPLAATPLVQPEPLAAPPEAPSAAESPAVAPESASPPAPAAQPPAVVTRPAESAVPVPEVRHAPEPVAPPVPAAEPEPEPAPVAPPVPIEATFEAREAAEFHVDPEDALVEIDGRVIGKADDWDDMGGGKPWVFAAPGDYLVKLSLPGYRTAWIRIRVHPDAEDDVADVDTDLEQLKN